LYFAVKRHDVIARPTRAREPIRQTSSALPDPKVAAHPMLDFMENDAIMGART